jgi:DNA-binding transcriptional MerR regulator
MAVIYSIKQLAEALNLEPWHVAYHLKKAEIDPLARVAGHRIYGQKELDKLKQYLAAHLYSRLRDQLRTQEVQTA